MKTETLLLCGGFGFVGKNLVLQLKDHYHLVVLDKNIDHDFVKSIEGIDYLACDFTDKKQLKEIIVKTQPVYIINLISIVTAERDLGLFDDLLKTNLKVLLNLYDACKELDSLEFFLQFGSGEEYGDIPSPYRETDREQPGSPYALAKQLTTNTATMLYRNYHFPIAVVRPGNLYGRFQSDQKFIPYIIKQLIKNETIKTTPGEQKRDFISVVDFSKGIEGVLKHHQTFIGEIFNLSTGTSVALKDIILGCKEYLHSTSSIAFGAIPYRENEMMDFTLDNSKFIKGTDGEFQFDFWTGLKKYMDTMDTMEE